MFLQNYHKITNVALEFLRPLRLPSYIKNTVSATFLLRALPAFDRFIPPLTKRSLQRTQTCFPSRYRAVHLSDTFSPPFLSHSSSL